MAREKPSVFMGGSSEKSEVIRKIAEALQPYSDVIPWWRVDSFKPTTSTLDGILRAAKMYDFGIFVFTPDDKSVSRGKRFFTARDNTLFEFGVFLGALGHRRTYGIVESSPGRPVKTPTDLLGIQIERFSYTNDFNLTASLETIASKLGRMIEEEGKRTFTLIHSWDFLRDERAFVATLDPARMQNHSDKIRGRKLLLVCRKRDPLVSRDEDTTIAMSEVRAIDLSEQHVTLKASAPNFEPRPGETVDGYLFLVPASVKFKSCTNMKQLKDAGCLLLDRDFGRTVG